MLLASTSPRRRDLLASLGRSFDVADPGVDDATEEALAREALTRGVDAQGMTLRLAIAKLLASLPAVAPATEVLSADTTVATEAGPIGKASDEDHAREILSALRDRSHSVHTGVAVARAGGELRGGVHTSTVRMRPFAASELEDYLSSGAWRGKAGAYGVQDAESGPLVDAVEGSDSNVRGLPLELVSELLS